MTAAPPPGSGGMRSRAATLGEAKRIRAAVRDQLRGHVKACGTCRPAGGGKAAWCDAGWALAKLYLDAREDVRWHVGQAPAGTAGLF